MEYKRYDISDTELSEGMVVKGTVKQIKPYGAFVEIENRNKRTAIYRRYFCI